MKVKKGVKIAGMRAEIMLAIMVADQVYFEFTGDGVVITEITGGKHGTGSLHYVGAAIDIRTNNLVKGMAEEIASEIRMRLGENYDVVVEADHIHIEFQPK